MVVYIDSKSNRLEERNWANQSLFAADTCGFSPNCNGERSEVNGSQNVNVNSCNGLSSTIENIRFIMCPSLANIDSATEHGVDKYLLIQQHEDNGRYRNSQTPTSILRNRYKPRQKKKNVKWRDHMWNKGVIDDFYSGHCRNIFSRNFELVEVLGEKNINTTSPVTIHYTHQTFDPIVSFRERKLSTLDQPGVNTGHKQKPRGNQLFASKNLSFISLKGEHKLSQGYGIKRTPSPHPIKAYRRPTQSPSDNSTGNQQYLKQNISLKKKRTPPRLTAPYRISEEERSNVPNQNVPPPYEEHSQRVKTSQRMLSPQKLRKSASSRRVETPQSYHRNVGDKESYSNVSSKNAQTYYPSERRLVNGSLEYAIIEKQDGGERNDPFQRISRQKSHQSSLDMRSSNNASRSHAKEYHPVTKAIRDRDFDIVEHIQNYSLDAIETSTKQKRVSPIDMPKHTEKRFAEIIWKSKGSVPKQKKGILSWRKKKKKKSQQGQLSQIPCYEENDNLKDDNWHRKYGREKTYDSKKKSNMAIFDHDDYDSIKIQNLYNFFIEPVKRKQSHAHVLDDESSTSLNDDYDPYQSEEHWQEVLNYDV